MQSGQPWWINTRHFFPPLLWPFPSSLPPTPLTEGNKGARGVEWRSQEHSSSVLKGAEKTLASAGAPGQALRPCFGFLRDCPSGELSSPLPAPPSPIFFFSLMHGFVCKLKVSGSAVFEAWSACQMELVSAFQSEIPGR